MERSAAFQAIPCDELEPDDGVPKGAYRSRCPLAKSLDVLGDRWTLLIIRDLFLGHSRFRDFTNSPEGISTNILSDRLSNLLRHAIIKRTPVSDGAGRFAYALTEKGEALRPILEAVQEWGMVWLE